jgi:hypothetical protein
VDGGDRRPRGALRPEQSTASLSQKRIEPSPPPAATNWPSGLMSTRRHWDAGYRDSRSGGAEYQYDARCGSISAARDRVFEDRYHLEVIKSPRQARNTLSYVLNNWRKHREDQAGPPATWLVDPFSSGISFPDWKEMEGRDVMWPVRDGYEPLMVRRPTSWLLREGWKKSGAVSALEVPSLRR